MNGDSGVMGLVDRRQGGAPVNSGQPTGIAVGHDLDRLAGILVVILQ